MSASCVSDQARQAAPAPSSANGSATTAAAGGFSNGMLSWLAGAPLGDQRLPLDLAVVDLRRVTRPISVDAT